MDTFKIQIVIALTFAVVLAMIIGIIIYIYQYRKGKILNIKEQKAMLLQHQQELLTTQLEIQTQTMQHIGREIHDNVGQKLTLASLYTKQLSADADKLQEKINSISNIIDESLADLRQLSKTLTDPELSNAGILALLTEEAKRINATGICYISVTANRDIILPQAEKNILFRLLQEFIQNSLKHSGCRKLFVDLQQTDRQLNVSASDDGKGFDTDSGSNGIGLQNMKLRAEHLKAVYSLKSQTGEGTRLSLQLPLSV